jgi:hypothetical protein
MLNSKLQVESWRRFLSLPADVGQLNSGEELRLVLKPSSRILVPGAILSILIALTVILIPLAVLLWLVIIWVYFSQVRARRYYVTTDRIILTRKFLSRDRRDLYLENVSDFTVDQGIWGRMLGFGAILPVTVGVLSPDATLRRKGKKANPRALYRMGGISHPYDMNNTVQSLRMAKSRPQQMVVTREVLVTCRHCGARVPQGTLRCPSCGANL